MTVSREVQKEIARLRSEGYSVKEIMEKTGVCEKTVRKYAKKAPPKEDIRDLTIREAEEKGLLDIATAGTLKLNQLVSGDEDRKKLTFPTGQTIGATAFALKEAFDERVDPKTRFLLGGKAAMGLWEILFTAKATHDALSDSLDKTMRRTEEKEEGE